MLIHCPTCGSPYDAEPDLAEAAGRVFRCDLCRDHWTIADALRAEPPGEDSPNPHGPGRPARSRSSTPAVERPEGDAFEIVTEARSARNHAGPGRAIPPHRAMSPPRRPRKRGSVAGWFCAGAACLAGMAAIHAKEAVVRAFPAAATAFAHMGLPVNLRGLALAEVRGVVTPGVGGPVLLLSGRISNLRPDRTVVPRLRFAVRDKGGRELYSWTAPAPREVLESGEAMTFKSRLAAPPEAGQDLVVAFAGTPARQVASRE